MSKFFYIKNTIATEMHPAVPGNMPWEFKMVTEPGMQVRESKPDRQDWYNNPATDHYFYTGIEPLNDRLRVTKEQNQPRYIHAFIADYDNFRLPKERILEAIEKMEIKPSWFEKSLGGNWRLIWTLEAPILVSDTLFCTFILQHAIKWLRLGLLPELDEKAFLSCTRTYCNGCDWTATGHPDVSKSTSHAFLVKCAKEYSFKPAGDNIKIPLETVLAALKVKFPQLEWDGDFIEESMGPSFWLPESKSPKSAIVKAAGFYTFSGSAQKSFYGWGDPELLGPAFVKQHNEVSITNATADNYFDNERWWQKVGGQWCPSKSQDFTRHLRVTCGLSAATPKEGVSQVDEAMEYIAMNNRIHYAASFVFQRSGPLYYNGKRVLNTYSGKAMEPHPGNYSFDDTSEFWFPYGVIKAMLAEVGNDAIGHFFAWWKHYYESAYNYCPCSGANLIMIGGTGTGKTLVNREMIGASVGGFIDASSYLVHGASFNSHNYDVGHWCVDDEEGNNVGNESRGAAAMRFKKMAANPDHVYSKKFEHGGQVSWMGRIGGTFNADYGSLQLFGMLDNNSLDKMCLFRCVDKHDFVFPSMPEIRALLAEQLPKLLKAILTWKYPPHLTPGPRFGPPVYKDEILLARIRECSPLAPVREALVGALTMWFKDNADEAAFCGTASQLFKLIKSCSDDGLLRGDVKQITRYLELIHKSEMLPCTCDTSAHGVKTWCFPRFPELTNNKAPVIPGVSDANPFNK